ncbi:MAG: hypothetical protein IPK25_18820 [Saprospiraceae bacterium]|nr:hypothetical protein [Saprospiraceae bacterium]
MITFPPEESGIMIVFGEPDAGIPENEYVPVETTPASPSKPVNKTETNKIIIKAKDDVSDIKVSETKKSTSKKKATRVKQQLKKRKKKKKEKLEKEAAEKKKKYLICLEKAKRKSG